MKNVESGLVKKAKASMEAMFVAGNSMVTQIIKSVVLEEANDVSLEAELLMYLIAFD